MVSTTRPISCLTLRSRSGVPIWPRKYFETTMLVACCDQNFGISTSRCSNTTSPFSLPMTAERSSHSTSSNGSTPGTREEARERQSRRAGGRSAGCPRRFTPAILPDRLHAGGHCLLRDPSLHRPLRQRAPALRRGEGTRSDLPRFIDIARCRLRATWRSATPHGRAARPWCFDEDVRVHACRTRRRTSSGEAGMFSGWSSC